MASYDQIMRYVSPERKLAEKWFKKLQREIFQRDFGMYWEDMKRNMRGKVCSESLKDPLDWTDEMFNKIYVRPLLESMITADCLLVAKIPVGIFYTASSDPNAYTIKPVDFFCGPVIVIDWTLYFFVETVIPLTIHAFFAPKEKRKDIRDTINDCILDITSNGRLGRIIKREKYNETVELVSHAIISGVLGYVIAHEYGHVILGHLDSNNVTTCRGGYAKYKKSWEQEYEADVGGLIFTEKQLDDLEHALLRTDEYRFFRASPLIAMILIQCLENHLGVCPETSTHPPTATRMMRLAVGIDPPLPKPTLELAQWFDWFLIESYGRHR